jgi:hypothetical protein
MGGNKFSAAADGALQQLGIGIKVDTSGAGIPATIIAVHHRCISVTDWVSLFWYWTGSGIDISFHFFTRLNEYQRLHSSPEECSKAQ